MKYGYIEKRKMLAFDLRTLCVKKDWYTHGNNEAYENLLHRVDSTENITTDDMVEIAADIIEHSEMSVDELENVCFELSEICHTFIEEYTE